MQAADISYLSLDTIPTKAKGLLKASIRNDENHHLLHQAKPATFYSHE